MLRRFEPALRGFATGRHTEWLSIRVPVYRCHPPTARTGPHWRVSLDTPAAGPASRFADGAENRRAMPRV
ncbi:hypothetical protein GCM10009596_21320 [Arthrobacter rhombi]